MTKPLWLPMAAVSHYSEVTSEYGQPVLSTTAADGHTQLGADAIQFGFSVFEGMRVFVVGDQYLVFRARDHHERLARSCAALALPCPDYDAFVAAIGLVVDGNHAAHAGRLYIRPIVFATGGGIMPQQDRSYTFAVLCTTFDPQLDGLKVFVETENPRTVPAFATVKTATNYTSSALVMGQAKKLGYDTVLWLDRGGHLQECTTMNVFLRMDGQVVTPNLGGILPGVTRRTLIELLAARGCAVVEREIHITEVVDAMKNGGLSGMCTTSTALGINEVALLRLGDDEYKAGSEPSDVVAAAKEDYRVLTEEFPTGLAKLQTVADRSHIGVTRGRE